MTVISLPFLKLYDSIGAELNVSRRLLKKVSPAHIDLKLIERLFGRRTATYWLVSNMPHSPAMLLRIDVVLNTWPGVTEFSAGFTTNGVADSEDFSIDSVIAMMKKWTIDPIPENVAKAAFSYVSYRPFEPKRKKMPLIRRSAA